jgi:hypothetical protein
VVLEGAAVTIWLTGEALVLVVALWELKKGSGRQGTQVTQ